MLKRILCTAAAAALLGVAIAGASPLVSGIDRSGFDESARPQDDFNRYVNGGWIDKTEIPADKSRWGSFDLLREASDKHQREIIEELSNKKNLRKGTEEQQVGDLYASLMDEKRINNRGTKAINPHLKRIDEIQTKADLVKAWAELAQSGVTAPFVGFINVDSGNSSKYALYLTQSGLGLPNRNYYVKDDEKFEKIRAAYPTYIADMFTLANLKDGPARGLAVYDLEMKIAQAHWKPEDTRDATKTNNRYKTSELKTVSDKISWTAFLEGARMSDVDDLFVRQPSYFTELGKILQEESLEDWKSYLQFHIIDAAAPWMTHKFVDRRFEFFGKMVNGQEEMQPRWQRAVQTVNGGLGEAVGKVYVERHFPPEAKERMLALVNNVLKAFELSINELEWMSTETKKSAQEKRHKFTTKIGYPDKWKDYSSLEIERNDAVGNLERIRQWDYNRRLARMNKPVDRSEWFMSPQTVNAYHNPRMNEIVFPAAILQPPFFNFEADDAVNYGAIGAVIGHEIGHAFDDQGRKTDGNGNLNDWWTEADAAAFKERADMLVEQYSGFEALPDLFVNGQLTLGENIGDLTGVTIGYKAYKMSLNGHEAPVIDGLSGDERFFMGFAQIWRGKYREEAMRRQVMTRPHSPGQFRANGPLMNFTPFYDTFGVKNGDGMYIPENERVKIW